MSISVYRLAQVYPALALLAACGGRSEPVITSPWQPVVTMSTDGGSGAAPIVARAADGRVTVAWVGAPDSGADGRLIVRPDIDSSAEVQLHDPAGSLTIYGETPPKLTYGPDGTLYAAYLLNRVVAGRKWPISTLRFIASSDHGAHWSEPSTVNAEGSSPTDHALLVAPDGTIYLTWLASWRDTSHTWVTHSTNRGRSWSAAVMVDSGPSCPCCRTAMASGPDGTLYAAWRRIYRDSSAIPVRDVVVAASRDDGATWAAPVRVHQDDWRVNYCPEAGPAIQVGRDGVVHVAWWTGKPGAAGVQYTQSHDAGRSFAAPIPLGIAAASRASHAQLALGDSQQVAVAWDDGTRAVPPIVVRISRDGGRTFSSPDVLTAPGQSGGYPVVAIAHDTVRVAWQQRTLAGVAVDSLRHQRETDSLKAAAAVAPMIHPVGSWSVVARSAAVNR